jgi:hypothetical protein
MTDQDYIDNSICNSFIETVLTDMSDAVIKQMIEDLHGILHERAEPLPELPKGNFLERCGEVGRELQDWYAESERVF